MRNKGIILPRDESRYCMHDDNVENIAILFKFMFQINIISLNEAFNTTIIYVLLFFQLIIILLGDTFSSGIVFYRQTDGLCIQYIII